MSRWVLKGIGTGIKSTLYPDAPEKAAGVSPGLPSCDGNNIDEKAFDTLIKCCPAQVFSKRKGGRKVDVSRCIHCMRCVYAVDSPVKWDSSCEWSTVTENGNKFPAPFGNSVHICVVDAGGCGACLHEVRQLNNPYYNMHRLGFFITPSPRHADLLLVVGAVTDHMKFALEKTYKAMPEPKRVVAVGTCALSGGVFADSFVCAKGLSEILPVDVEIPGNPPSPLAILHGLLVAVGRKKPRSNNEISSAREK